MGEGGGRWGIWLNMACESATVGTADLQCHPQHVDGVLHVMEDVLLHQLLTHPQAQAAHRYAPGGRQGGTDGTAGQDTLQDKHSLTTSRKL